MKTTRKPIEKIKVAEMATSLTCYRFGDTISLNIDNAKSSLTVYIPFDALPSFIRALEEGHADIESTGFVQSHYQTREIIP